ncbi:PAS domain-containing sensor histidine kinase [Methylophilus sp. QUAN]|uniref:sensor histidine kinase n=1 Tax=Methylophilus sp. QUAN TaxID=2781020 RepID=UPI00188EA53F|nr:PAS domain-containing sensor histidine kinase [Methylophilus sp. QUAN]MBF4990951.1 PAS domain-containing sensor histidine kinase [Methylophilus sp. QUAN]
MNKLSTLTVFHETQASLLNHRLYEEDYISVIENSPDGIVLTQEDGLVIYANKNFLSFTSLQKEKVIDQPFSSVNQELINKSNSIIQRGEWGVLYKLNQDNKNNPKKFYRRKTDLKNQFINDQGELVVLQKYEVDLNKHNIRKVIYFKNITQEYLANNNKTEFLLAAAHELKNPITNIIGFSEILMDKKGEDEDFNFMIDVIHSQSLFLNKILKDLLDINNIELNTGCDFDLQQLEINHEVEKIQNQYFAPTNRGKVEFIKYPANLYALIDQTKFKQALFNLLNNAYKYSKSTVTIRVNYLSSKKEIAISVIDFGIGLSYEQQSQLFKRFWRADTQNQIEGVGLGLVLVKEIIELMNGRIEIYSRKDIGTSAIIFLPLSELT